MIGDRDLEISLIVTRWDLISRLYSALPNMAAPEEIHIPKVDCHGQAIMRKP